MLEAMGRLKSYTKPSEQGVLAEVSGCSKAVAPG